MADSYTKRAQHTAWEGGRRAVMLIATEPPKKTREEMKYRTIAWNGRMGFWCVMQIAAFYTGKKPLRKALRFGKVLCTLVGFVHC